MGRNIPDIPDGRLGRLWSDFVAKLLRDLLADVDAFLDIVIAFGVEAVAVDHGEFEVRWQQLPLFLGVEADE